jgi:hypothetical protein
MGLYTFNKLEEVDGTVSGFWNEEYNAKYHNMIFNVNLENPILRVERWNGNFTHLQSVDEVNTNVSSVALLVHTNNSAFITNETVIAKVIFYYDDGTFEYSTLVQGINVGEWAFARETSEFIIHHQQPSNIGYTFRTMEDCDRSYNGYSYLANFVTNGSKLMTSIALQIEDDVDLGISVDALTINTGIDLISLYDTGKIPKVYSLPNPDVSLRGAVIRIEGGTGVEDTLYVCKKLADDSYSWVEIQ